MASLDYRLNPLFTIKECSSCGSLYNKGYCCTPNSSQQPLRDCPKCGNPVEGPNCQGCALWQKKLKEVWFTICHENGIYQDLLNTYESSDDDTNVDIYLCITQVLSTNKAVDSLIIEDEHLDTIPATESEEVIKSSVENLVQILSEFKGISKDTCDVPVCEDPSTFDALSDHYEILSDSNNDDTSSDDDSYENIEYVEASPLNSEIVSLEDIEPDQGGLTGIVIFDNSNNPLLELPELESFHFNLDPSFPRPPLEPPDVEISLIIETDAPVINNFDELNEDECFNPGGMRLMLKMTIPSHLSFGLFSRFSLTLWILFFFTPSGVKTPFLTPASPLRAGGISSGWNFHGKGLWSWQKSTNGDVNLAKKVLVGDFKLGGWQKCPPQSTDIAKISRKRSKPENHRHGNGIECAKAGRMLSKVNKSQLMVPLVGSEMDEAHASKYLHPQVDGQSERKTQTLEDIMRAYVIDFGSSYHLSIWCAPFEAMYGRKCRSPVLWVEIGESSLTGLELVQETSLKRAMAIVDDSACLHVPLDEIKVDKNSSFFEEPVENSDVS
ncbi:ribonuclease H-like domain-containing protein [Tanacetum coccineum]